MRSILKTVAAGLLGSVCVAGALHAQVGGRNGAPWRGAGPQPCFNLDGGIYKCPAATGVIAVKAGHLFDSRRATMLADQVILVKDDRITGVGPAARITIPAGARVIDLTHETVLPGMVDMHTHMFNEAKPGVPRTMETLLAVQNTQADLRAGFTAVRDMSTHGNGYDDVVIRDAIDKGLIEGPRAQVSTRGIVWGVPGDNTPADPGKSAVVHNVEEARAAVRDQISHGADWIKLFPAGAYSFEPDGKVSYVVTYPMPVLQALIDETHRLGHKAGCHVFGGEGQKNAIIAGCDSIEHAYGLDQEQANMIVAKHLNYDPTLQRYTEPYMDDVDARKTGGKYRMIPIFEHAVTMASRTPGLHMTTGSGADGSTIAHGSGALELVALVQESHLPPARVLQAATINGAETLGWQDRIGSLEKGKFADIAAMPGDPLTDITATERVNFVMKGGKVVRDDR
jgi:imidazolonepropionase-like amidohydrolase